MNKIKFLTISKFLAIPTLIASLALIISLSIRSKKQAEVRKIMKENTGLETCQELIARDKNKPACTNIRQYFKEMLVAKQVPTNDVKQICFYAEKTVFAIAKKESDQKTYKVPEFWAGPEITILRKAADCEDLSMLFAMLVMDYNIPVEIVATATKESHSYAMVNGLGYMLFEIQKDLPIGLLSRKNGKTCLLPINKPK